MATSGSKSVTVTSWDTLKFSWSESSQDVTNNKTTISWKMELISGSSGRIDSSASKSWSVTVNGTKYSGTNTIGIGNNTTKTLASGTTTISHNADGTKSFSYSFSQEFSINFGGTNIGTKTGSGSGTLDTIARKSTLTASNGTLGTAQTLTINRNSSSFTHTITYKCGTDTGMVVSKTTGTSMQFTPDLSLATQNKTGTSVSIVFTIETFNGSTSLGTNTKTITCAIPSSVKPTVSIAVSDPMGYASTYGGYVQNRSKIKVVVTASGNQGSTIKSYSTSANGHTYTTSTVTTDVITSTGTLTISTTVKDSRGRTATASTTITALAYAKPKISSFKVTRNGDKLDVKFSASITSLNSKNRATYRLKYKKVSDTEYTGVTLSDYEDIYSVSNGTYSFDADTGSSFNLILTATDSFETATKNGSGPSGKSLFSIYKEGLGWAFGKVAELANVLDIAFETLFRSKVTFKNDLSIMGETADGSASYSALIPVSASGNTSLGYGLYNAKKGHTYIYGNDVQFFTNDGIYFNGNDVFMNNAQNIYGKNTDGTKMRILSQSSNDNTIIGYDNYDKKSGNTHLYGHDLLHYVSNIATPGSYRPYRRQGDTLDVVIRTSGYVTNGGKDVFFTVPFSAPIVGNPTVTVDSSAGMTLRQNDAYTHGSTADKMVKPNSYTVSRYMWHGIIIKASFSTTTNVENNSSIGIHWDGTITLS